MSDYGVFEATSTDGHEEEQRQRQAKRNLGTAIEAAREGFGDFLGSSTDKQDYNDRLALVMNDLMQKVADSGVMPVPGVMRKVKAALRPEFRVADDHLDAPGVDMSQLRLDGLGNYGDAVAVVFDDSGNAVDLALNWETAQSMAQEGYDVQVVRGDGGRSQDEIQRMVDHEKELRRDLFGSRKTASRSLSEIAAEIRADWKNVYFGAEPYLDAMSSLDSIDDSYGQDSAKSIVAYFLSNATSWRGETARRVKKELKELSKRKATRKTAIQWDRNDGDSASYSSQDAGLDYWIKNVNGQWEWSIFDFLSGEGDQGTAFDFEEAESYIEDFIANSDPDAYFDRLEASKQAAAPWETFYTTDTRLDGSESEQYTARLGNGVTLEAFEDPYSTGGWGWSVWLTGDDGIKRYQVGGEAGSPDEAKKAAEAASQERKQAGSAQVLQKLENALNDQRSVDVICSNSPDGSFSSEREISVDEGLQKVRGWVSAGDLVDTAQGGNFFDFEHRASGENVNFYITQEY